MEAVGVRFRTKEERNDGAGEMPGTEGRTKHKIRLWVFRMRRRSKGDMKAKFLARGLGSGLSRETTVHKSQVKGSQKGREEGGWEGKGKKGRLYCFNREQEICLGCGQNKMRREVW